jgi:hypothetical protein
MENTITLMGATSAPSIVIDGVEHRAEDYECSNCLAPKSVAFWPVQPPSLVEKVLAMGGCGFVCEDCLTLAHQWLMVGLLNPGGEDHTDKKETK